MEKYENRTKLASGSGEAIKFLNNHQTPYFIFYNSVRCARVTAEVFKNIEYPCFVYGKYKIKYNTSTGSREVFRKKFIKLIANISDRLLAQSLFSKFSILKEYLYKSLSLLRRMIDIVGNISQVTQHHQIISWILDVILSISDVVARPHISGLQLMIILLKFAKLYKDSPLLPQSVQSVLMSLVALGLPNNVIEAFKKLTLFTQIKIGDDFVFIFTIIRFFTEKICQVFETFGLDLKCFSRVTDMWDSFFQHYSILQEIDKYYSLWSKNRRILVQQEIQEEILKLHEKASTNITLQEWARTSNNINVKLQSLSRLYKLVLSYRNVTRQEPVCIAFEGPAGCFKSTLMSAMVTVLNKSVYSHEIKSIMDGKDFYDQYDNQDIMLLDDLGQGGPSQYRCLFNLVSPVKHPLDCANEKLKDTKFFTSEAVLFTTNHFTKLKDYSKADGITDIHALWRRVCVMDFAGVKRTENRLSGKVKFLAYDLNLKLYRLHQVVSTKSSCGQNCELEPEFVFDDTASVTDNENRFLVWACKWYNYKMSEREKFKMDNTIDADRLEQLRKLVEQKLDDDDDSYLAHYSRCMKNLVDSAYNALTDDDEYNQGFMSMLRNSFFPNSEKPASWLSSMKSTVQSYWEQHKLWFISAIVLFFVMMLVSWLVENRVSKQDELRFQSLRNLKIQASKTTTMNDTILSQTFFIEYVKKDDTVETAVGVISGHYILCPYHASKDTVFVNVHSPVEGCKLLDHAPVTEFYTVPDEDVMVLKLDEALMLPFKKLSKVFRYNNTAHKSRALLTPLGALPVLPFVPPAVSSVVKLRGKSIVLDNTNSLAYTYTLEGLCGSLVVNDACGVIGSHVAGNEHYGRALIWKPETLANIIDIFEKDRFLLNVNVKECTIPSGIKLEANYHQQTPKKTNIVPSPLFGLYENYKQPSDLSKYGPHTVKDIAKKSFAQVENVPFHLLDFSKQYLNTIIEPFTPITEQDVVKGFDNVAGIDMTTSTGIMCLKDRNAYIDKEQGCFTPLLRSEISSIEQNIIEDEDVSLDLWIAKETLKDEVRSIAKDGEPRSFRVLRFPINILCKQLTGAMVNNLIGTRFEHGIMVGINPYTEWDKLHDMLNWRSQGIIAADIKKYDGNMLAQVQYLVRDVLVEKLQSNERDKKVLHYILTSFIMNPVAINDDVVLTTHSMPSGCYLTAIMNSLVHKCYTAMWYKKYVPEGNITTMCNDIFDAVYGDDKVCSVRNKKEQLNALTMRDFFRSIGLDLSTADKKEIVEAFDCKESINFLKRKFTYHFQIGRIMPELVEETLLSMLQWIDTTKEFDAAFGGKVNSFLIEAYLTPHYTALRSKLEQALNEKALYYPLFSTQQILSILKNGELDSPYNCHL
jgi:hypothetical protein